MLKGKHVVIMHPGNPKFDFRLKKTVNILAKAGAQVTVLAYLSLPENDIQDWNCTSACVARPFTMFKASENKIWLLRVLWNITVLNVQLFFERQVDVCEGLAKRAEKLNPDLIYCIGIETVEEGHKLLKTTEIPLVYEAYEYYPALLKNNLYFDKPAKNRKYYSLEKKLLLNERVSGIVVGEEIARGYVKHYGCKQPTVIHNVAPSRVEKIERHDGPLRFYFQSYLRPTYNIEKLIASFARLDVDATLTIQGNAHEKGYFESLQSFIREQGNGEKIFLKPACPYEQVVEEASRYDVGLISLSANRANGFDESVYLALPNKLYTYASAGLAVLVANYPAQSRLLREYNCGLTYEAGNVENLISTIKYCVANREEIEVMRNNSLALANEYSIDNEGKKLVAFCNQAASMESVHE